jgi:hypothetical protein
MFVNQEEARYVPTYVDQVRYFWVVKVNIILLDILTPVFGEAVSVMLTGQNLVF